jgi:hypothetical protein
MSRGHTDFLQSQSSRSKVIHSKCGRFFSETILTNENTNEKIQMQENTIQGK